MAKQFGATLRLRVDGLDEAILGAVARALFQETETVMGEIKSTPIVPVDTGVLRGSGYVEPPATVGKEVSVVAGFGGPASEYAEVQHENLTYRHTVGQAKYLSAPMELAQGRMHTSAELAAQQAAARHGSA